MNNKEKKNKKIIERLVGSFIEKNIIDNIDKDDVKLNYVIAGYAPHI